MATRFLNRGPSKSRRTSRKFGEEGTNTPPSPSSDLARTIVNSDYGFTMTTTNDMYRIGETHPGRREPTIPNLHNLSDAAFQRTLRPSFDITDKLAQMRRAILRDKGLKAVSEALKLFPMNAHINISANFGPNTGAKAAALEKLPPWTTVRGALAGLLFVTEFRKDDEVHPDWIQIAIAIKATEGRLLAGLRILPSVLRHRMDLTFHITNLTNPSVSLKDMNLPTNLGCFFHRGGIFSFEAGTFRASFAWDGDLYGWDEAMLYTRKPIAVITDAKPERRFIYWYKCTVLRNVAWFSVVDGRLHGARHRQTTRADIMAWDKSDGIPGSFIDES